jgi:cytochrome c oxidase assembly protein subunit 15
MTTPHSGARTVTDRSSAPALRPTRNSGRGLALASVIANAVLVCAGAAVRLSSSGLGCPDRRRCTTASVVAAHSAGQTPLNTAIESGDWLLTFPLAVTAALTFIACLRYQPGGRRRHDLALLSVVLPGGVIAQAVAGGIVMLTRLNPLMGAAAVVPQARAADGPGPVRPVVRASRVVLADRRRPPRRDQHPQGICKLPA